MERLDLIQPPENLEIETAIHLARYANIIALVKDKVVLDVACGEGYGTALLMQAGAKRAVGVDISATAIDKAKQTFSDSGAEYILADVSNIESIFDAETFDVIVSIETIEHVENPQGFLRSLAKLARPEAIFYVTCPNDHWYYPDKDQSNPYHRRKFTFDEFADMTTAVLGRNVNWALGTAIFGFGTTPLSSSGVPVSFNNLYHSWMKLSDSGSSFVAPNESHSPLSSQNCSYFAGIWNLKRKFLPTSSHFPVSMDAYGRMYDALAYDPASTLRVALGNAKIEIEKEQLNSTLIQAEVAKQQEEYKQLHRDARNKGLRMHAAQAENKALRENLGHLQYEHTALKNELVDTQARATEMETGYRRYTHMSRRVPTGLKKTAVKIVRALKRG